VQLLEAGAHVRLKSDSKGYINTPEDLIGASTIVETARSSRGETITRLAVLKAAAEFCGLWGQTSEEVKSEHVLMLADRWLAWVEGQP
jgi:hypothetical protein